MRRERLLTGAVISTLALSSLRPAEAAEDPDEWVQLVRESNKRSIVFISVQATRKNGLVDRSAGTGFIVDPQGYVLTCDHVVPSEGSEYAGVEVTGAVGGRSEHPYPLKVIRRDSQADLVVLKLPQGPSVWRSVESGRQGKIGSSIVAFGFPLSKGLVHQPGSITGTDDETGRWLTNAPTSRGMSGGPVFDRSGALVAVVAAGYEETQGLNLVIPITFAGDLLKHIGSRLLDGVAPGQAEQAYRIRQKLIEAADSVSEIQQTMSGGAPLFAAVASLEQELNALLKDVPAEQRLASLGSSAGANRAATLAWRDPKAAALAAAIIDARRSLGSPPMSGDWEILGALIDLLSAMSADTFSAQLFARLLSPELLGMAPMESPEPLDTRQFVQRLSSHVQSNVAAYYVVRYHEAASMIADLVSLLAASSSKLSDASIVRHSRAPEVESGTRTGMILEMLSHFRDELDTGTYERLVSLARGIEDALSKDSASQRAGKLQKRQADSGRLERSELVEAIFRCLKRAGVQDPTLDLFLGVFSADSEMVAKALDTGGSPSTTDSELLETYQAIVASECPDLYLKYQASKEKAPAPEPEP